MSPRSESSRRFELGIPIAKGYYVLFKDISSARGYPPGSL